MKRTRFTLTAVERDGQWIAHAVREDNGDRFGIECAAASEPDAIGLLTEADAGQTCAHCPDIGRAGRHRP